jgi:hypothetical protein
MGKSLTQEEFIDKLKEIFGDSYDYSLVDYRRSDIYVTLVCPVHGPFPIYPGHLLRGYGCSRCRNRKKTTEDFVKQAMDVHGSEYDYSDSIYTGSKRSLIIKCKKHGAFKQVPNSHLRGAGCRKCLKHKPGRKPKYLSSLPFDELKKIIQPLGLKRKKEYFKWWNDNKKYCIEMKIPRDPYSCYKKNQEYY